LLESAHLDCRFSHLPTRENASDAAIDTRKTDTAKDNLKNTVVPDDDPGPSVFCSCAFLFAIISEATSLDSGS
jgi:hypothetical protein